MKNRTSSMIGAGLLVVLAFVWCMISEQMFHDRMTEDIASLATSLQEAGTSSEQIGALQQGLSQVSSNVSSYVNGVANTIVISLLFLSIVILGSMRKDSAGPSH